jgi:hypothetical protein
MAAFVLGCMRAVRRHEPLPAFPAVDDATYVANAADYAGTFRCGAKELVVVAEDGRLTVRSHDMYAALGRRGTDAFVALGAPQLDRFLLQFERDGAGVVALSHGSEWYVAERYRGPVEFVAPAAWKANCGHYRAHTPWQPDVRVVLRNGQIYLVYWWGQEVALLPAEPGRFRIGAGGHPSEVIWFDSIVNGQAQRALLDGCTYYQYFTP